MAGWVVRLDRVAKRYANRAVLDDVSLTFLVGAKVGVVGPNGTGKSTLLRMMAGVEAPTGGTVDLIPGTTVGLLPQEPRLDESATVVQNIRAGIADTMALIDRYDAVAARLADEPTAALIDERGDLQERLDHARAWDVDGRLDQAMEALRCPPPDTPVSRLSGGERRRVALCGLLISRPDLLLLDEPTNHLDAESVQWLEEHLRAYPGTVVAVTHDRYFLDNAAGWILELDRGRCHPYEGNYSTYLEQKAGRLTVEGRKDAKRARRLADELAWVRSSAKARQTKARARLHRYDEMAAEAAGNRRLDFAEIRIPTGPRLGTTVIEAHELTKGFDGRPLFDGLSFSLPRNGIVGIIGPNGVGKTTLFQMIVGRERPDAGTITVGASARIAYVDQLRSRMNPDATAWELISGGHDHIDVGGIGIPSRAYVAAFGFTGAEQQKPARLFSGGERNRLNLALTLRQGGNVLLLDEPTNDLDIETLSSLENALLAFPGCAVITAHDRWFLDRVATHILAWEGGAEWSWFEGNFAAYEQYKTDRLGAATTRPPRTVHRRLARG